LKSLIIKFVLEKLRIMVIFGTFLAVVLFVAFGKNIFVDYTIGFVTGCVNFVVLSIGTEMIVSGKPKKLRIIHFLFFTFRYLLIALILIELVRSQDANLFAVAGGLLTNNLALILYTFGKHFFQGKEG
jgi:hypothetical protein